MVNELGTLEANALYGNNGRITKAMPRSVGL